MASTTRQPSPTGQTGGGATVELAEWSSALRPGDLPDEVAHAARRCLIDWLAVALGGGVDEAAVPLLSVVRRCAPVGESVVVGHEDRIGAPFAALANGFFAHVHDFDDTYLPGRTTVHPSAPVWAAVLAAVGERRTSGADALTAFVAGVEVQHRVALAAGPSHYERGWHVTGTVGHFGAAAATAHVLELSRDGTVAALGTAGTQAAGLKEVYGTMGKPLHPGKAAFDGVLSAFLAEEGFTSTTTILEGPRGFLAVTSEDADPSQLVENLGERWTLPETGFKPYACGVLTHPTVQGVLELRDEHDLAPDRVVAIEARVHDYVRWVTGKPSPTTGLEGKFSVFHAAAVALLDGAARLQQFTDERVNAPDVVALRDRVRIEVDDDLPKEAAVVTVILDDGRRLERRIDHGLGTMDAPLDDGALTEKLVDLATPTLGADGAEHLGTAAWAFDHATDARELLELTRPRR